MKTRTTTILVTLLLLGAFFAFRLRNGKPDQEIPPPETKLAGVPENRNASRAVPKRSEPAKTQPAVPAPAVDALSSVPESMRSIVDLQAAPLARLESARALKLPLSQEELQALYTFLLERHPEDDTQLGHVLKNQLMNVLSRAEPLPAGWDQTLMQVFGDRGQSVVLRDYALQHLPEVYDRSSAKDSIHQLFREALAEVDSSIAGTALLGLRNLALRHPEISAEEPGAAAVELARQAGVSELTRVTAVQICAELKRTEALPVLSALLRSAESTAVQISAIGAIGRLGSKAEVALLNEVIAAKNQRLAPVATLALNRLESRFTPQ
jgi:hypothetical protein